MARACSVILSLLFFVALVSCSSWYKNQKPYVYPEWLTVTPGSSGTVSVSLIEPPISTAAVLFFTNSPYVRFPQGALIFTDTTWYLPQTTPVFVDVAPTTPTSTLTATMTPLPSLGAPTTTQWSLPPTLEYYTVKAVAFYDDQIAGSWTIYIRHVTPAHLQFLPRTAQIIQNGPSFVFVTVQVALTRAPTANVDVTVHPFRNIRTALPTPWTISTTWFTPMTLTFTSANWATYQIFTIPANQLPVMDSFYLPFTYRSTDPAYNGAQMYAIAIIDQGPRVNVVPNMVSGMMAMIPGAVAGPYNADVGEFPECQILPDAYYASTAWYPQWAEGTMVYYRQGKPWACPVNSLGAMMPSGMMGTMPNAMASFPMPIKKKKN